MTSEERTDTTAARSLLLTGIREHAILRGDKHFLAAPDGSRLSWLVDLRRVLLQGKYLAAFVELFWERYKNASSFQVCGLETAAIPLITAIVMSSLERGTPVNGFIVRRERKTYGTANQIEGHLNDFPVVIVDDLLNSGQSMEKVRVVLDEAGHLVDSVYVVLDFQARRGLEWRKRWALRVDAITTLNELGLSQPMREPAPPLATFREVWSFASPSPNWSERVPKSFPVIDGARIYFGSDCGMFWCLDTRDASVVWSFRVHSDGHKNIWSSPALRDGHVYFGAYDGNVYSRDALTGAEIWRFEGADWVGSSPVLAPDLGLLFIGLEFAEEHHRGSIMALSLRTGEPVWEHPTRRFTHASPAYWPAERVVACGSNDNELFLLDALTGAVRWRFETQSDAGKGSIRHAPAFDLERRQLVTGCSNGDIYIIDVDSGRELWTVRTGNTVYTVPLVVNGFAYVGSTDKYMYILDLDRRKVHTRLYIGSKVYGPARLLLGRIYFGACNGVIYELSPSTHKITGKHQVADGITNALTCDPEIGRLYALTYTNKLFAFDRDEDVIFTPKTSL
ncbi:Outer membrane protein assembly factor BamB, contains PQQ-like beta-propeller repeat [Granulicella rosea]|uniref:Outer membrane protein assembly factor BamB, contains PQQ-like beta-propeller repeat n=1 Tax=Granulicella rosea TaxID=474952 RepID=A0A239GUL1_9BACT|nr:PQQ-binding-like beta-propeller repeat protein [Granulicella rosea]SNS72193.1 Outer membrane protein assembly factor BamB, contains PQQ-like beta-propeller repeat [Granulicella rosea]